MALNGTLDDYSPAGALRVLSSGAKSGAVRFTGAAGCTVYLHRGQLYFARDEQTDHALAAALVRPGRLSADEWSRCVAEAGDQPRVGELIVSGAMIDPDLLASVVLSVVYDPLIRLFREGDGSFEFEEGTVHWIGPFRAFNVDAIANEVRRRVREVDEMTPLVPTIDSWVTAERTLPGTAAQVTLLREDWELVTSLAGPRSIAELAGDMGRGRYSTARVVHRLAQAGLVTVAPMEAASLAHEPSPDDLDLPVAAEAAAPADGYDALGSDPWAPIAEPDAEHEPSTGSSRGYDPHPAVSEEEAIGGWALPKRSLAVEEQERTSPWPESEDLDMDDPANTRPRSGLMGLGLRSAVGPDGQPEEAEDSPNAEWLQTLYQEYMDEPEQGAKPGKKEAIDVAFAAEDQDSATKIPTLRRLMDALKKL